VVQNKLKIRKRWSFRFPEGDDSRLLTDSKVPAYPNDAYLYLVRNVLVEHNGMREVYDGEPYPDMLWTLAMFGNKPFRNLKRHQRMAYCPGNANLHDKGILAEMMSTARTKWDKVYGESNFAKILPPQHRWPADRAKVYQAAQEGRLFVLKKPSADRAEGLQMFDKDTLLEHGMTGPDTPIANMTHPFNETSWNMAQEYIKPHLVAKRFVRCQKPQTSCVFLSLKVNPYVALENPYFALKTLILHLKILIGSLKRDSKSP